MNLTLLAVSVAVAFNLHLAGEVRPPDSDQLAAARALGLAEGYRHVADTPGNWRYVALEHDYAFVWESMTTVALECDGGAVEALEVFAMTPPAGQRIIRLGGLHAVVLDPDGLWRKRFRNGPVCTVLFARFPAGSCRGEPTGLRVVRTRAIRLGQ